MDQNGSNNLYFPGNKKNRTSTIGEAIDIYRQFNRNNHAHNSLAKDFRVIRRRIH